MVTTLLRRGAHTARRRPCTARRIGPLRLEALESRTLLSAGLQPTAQEQLLLQQLNAIRANPTAYGQSIGLDLSSVAPSQPLAFSTLLESSAQAHSQDMNDQNYFGHNSSTGVTPDARMTAAGFNWYAWGESIAAGFPTSTAALQALIVDQGVADLGHRIQLLALNSLYQSQNQVGIGMVSGSGSYGTYYTIDTARAAGDSNAILTGVVFNDNNGNHQYGIGEGLGGVTVTASNGASTTTFGSGGYSLELTPGTYAVTFSGGGLTSAVTRQVSVGSQNVEVDVTNPPPQAPPPQAAPVVTGPILAAIPDQNVSNSSGTVQLPLSASDPAGQSLTYQVSVQGSGTSSAIQQLNLHPDSSGYHQNMMGLNEKWVVGNGSALWGWYAIMPDGTVRPWEGGQSFGAAVGSVGAAVWADPTLLANLSSSSSAISGSVSGNTLTLTGLQGYTGTLRVAVTVSDGVGLASQSFNVNVTSGAVTLAPIANVTAAHGSPVQVALASSDASGAAVSYQVQVSGDNPAYDLEKQLNLTYTGNLLQNAIGMNEKWLQSTTGNAAFNGWYAIMPDGEIRPWTGGNTVGATVANLGSAVYADPSLLYNASAPTAGASFSGSILTLTPPGNYLGSLHVIVTATDGTSRASQQFTVTLS
jgi:uncharacterized protein YkwD